MIRLDRGLKVAISSAVANGLGVQATASVLFALFMTPITIEWHWTRTQYTLIAAVAPVVVTLVVSWLGLQVDRRGARAVIVPGKIVFCFAVMLLALSQPSMLVMGVLWVMFGLAAATQGPAGYTKAIAAHYHRNRGLALALALGVGGAVGGIFVSLITGFVIQHYGWKVGYIVLGGLPLLVSAPLLYFWFKPIHESEAALGRSRPITITGMTGREARRTRAFWLIFSAVTLHNFALGALTAHAVPLLIDRGFTIEQGGMLMAVLLSAAGLARFGCGWVLDRVESPKVAVPFFFAAFLGAVLLNFSWGTAMAVASVIAIGVGSGGEGTLIGYFTTRYFGLRSTGEVYANFYTVQILAGAFSPVLLAVTLDYTGSYTFGLIALSVALLVGVGLIAALGPYVFPAVPPDEEQPPIPEQAVGPTTLVAE
jgi:MFS family permease